MNGLSHDTDERIIALRGHIHRRLVDIDQVLKRLRLMSHTQSYDSETHKDIFPQIDQSEAALLELDWICRFLDLSSVAPPVPFGLMPKAGVVIGCGRPVCEDCYEPLPWTTPEELEKIRVAGQEGQLE